MENARIRLPLLKGKEAAVPVGRGLFAFSTPPGSARAIFHFPFSIIH
jgi:hypothetical protein